MEHKILITGASGYIGARLTVLLVNQGWNVVAMVRDRERFRIHDNIKKKIEIIEVDLLKKESYKNIPNDITHIFYLIHAMSYSENDFMDLESQATHNLLKYCNESLNILQFLFLTGIAHDKEKLSQHLQSRKNTEDLIIRSSIPYTILRAGIIIGSGSASFEIIRDLVEHLPIMLAPKWIKMKCQPIAILDAVTYLSKVLNNKKCINKGFDIGGPEVLSYKEMLLQYARHRKLYRLILVIPLLTPRLSSLWIRFVTSANLILAKNLIESMCNNVVCRESRIQTIIPHQCLNYQDSLKRVFQKIEHDEVTSSWKDTLNYSKISSNLHRYINVPVKGCLTLQSETEFSIDKEYIINEIFSIGGDSGYYYADWTWKIRGSIDKIIGGVGLRRGRTNTNEIHFGDALDWWRVIVCSKKEGRLLLYAEMKSPGESWLEFDIIRKENKDYIQTTATFRPHGIIGRIYWWILWPIHWFIFRGMPRKLVKKAQKKSSDDNQS